MLPRRLCRLIHPSRLRFYTTERAIFLDEKQLEALGSDAFQMTNVTMVETGATHEPVVRGSRIADFGRKRVGCVHLPKQLVQGVKQLIDESDKRLLRTDALRLYESLRSTSRVPKEQVNDQKKAKSAVEPHTLSYGPREAIAYTAGLMPASYAAVSNVLSEVSQRLENFQPKTVLDFGCGPGTAIWAAQETFNLESCVAVDLSEDMLQIAERLGDQTKAPVEYMRYLTFDPRVPNPDLVISAFTLGDIPSAALQKSIVHQLWDKTGDVLVLIDRGTPIGFSNIARARQWILDTQTDDKESHVHVVAPCPHDRPCPLLYSPAANTEKFWCHFSQRVERPSYLMKTKHSKFNTEDSKYAYVVLRRGPRPEATWPPAQPSLDEFEPSEAYAWPRLIQPPLKKQGHIVMDVCASNGGIQRMVIPKSQGKIPYRDARKSAWGDLFPHPSKNKVVTRVPPVLENVEA